MTGAMRYAIYLAPEPDTALWRFGSALLGYDAETGTESPPMALPGFDPAAVAAMTEEPRRYGFHMTLKAPFRLAETADEAGLVAALAGFARGMTPFDLGQLILECRPAGRGGSFVCLVPSRHSPELAALESAIVEGFDRFRAPLSEAELARRRPELLPPRERGLLERFGYPFVLEAFRPHFSLTGVIADPAPVADALSIAIAEAMGAARFRCNGLALFRQEAPGARFRILARFPAAAIPEAAPRA